MDAGKLNQRIEIQRQSHGDTPSGQQAVGDWETIHRVWAQVECRDSTTVDGDGYTHHEGLYRFYIRWRKGITADMRVRWDGRTFELTGPPADWKTEKTGLTLIAKELI